MVEDFCLFFRHKTLKEIFAKEGLGRSLEEIKFSQDGKTLSIEREGGLQTGCDFSQYAGIVEYLTSYLTLIDNLLAEGIETVSFSDLRFEFDLRTKEIKLV